ncbi:helix-turn-helix DNA binding domain protein [Arthrobacter phage Bolt007]|uniref:Helix-turn-helix DNA binding domain protein n=1 Tax=Arthrobacter phage Bolt007 TaxID=3017297 RepID=A0AA49E546_9CAUD|nr:helix-turn-helix DNA binding domain protein [Arthrobacter phage Bolt007]
MSVGARKLERERIRDLLAAGLSATEIARRVGVHPRTVLRAKHEAGIPVREYVRRTIGPEDLALIESCLVEGWSFNEIERTHGYTHGTLAKYFPGRGMDPREACLLGPLVRQTNRLERISA